MTARRAADSATVAEQAFAFSLPGYRALLASMLGRGYEAVPFSVAEPSRRHLVLRHDLDMSLQAALPVAEAEAALGVAATYFVLLRTEFYNLHTPRAEAALATLRLLGHSIGLHFDASLYKEDDLDALDTAAAGECAALEEIVGAPVEMISFHRPAPGLVGLDRTLAGRDHAYRPRYVMAMGYCSDSRGAWHHGHPLDHPALAEGRALQLLTHPVWWTGQGDETPVALLERFLGHRLSLLQQDLAANCEPYRQRLRRTDGDGAGDLAVRLPVRISTLEVQHIRDHMPAFLAIAADVADEYWSQQHFLIDLPDKWTLSFALWRCAVPIGYAILSRKGPNHVHLHHFMLATPYRGLGLGAAMVRETLLRARAADADMLTLKTAVGNAAAHAFYRRQGFVRCGSDGDYAVFKCDLAGVSASPARAASGK